MVILGFKSYGKKCKTNKRTSGKLNFRFKLIFDEKGKFMKIMRKFVLILSQKGTKKNEMIDASVPEATARIGARLILKRKDG